MGAVTEQVSVEANAALVETRSSGIGEVVQNQRILELPLNGRQVTDLLQFTKLYTVFDVHETEQEALASF